MKFTPLRIAAFCAIWLWIGSLIAIAIIRGPDIVFGTVLIAPFVLAVAAMIVAATIELCFIENDDLW